MDGYRWTAMMLKALGHPIRLQILDTLRHDEACVSHLEFVLGKRQSYISQQLALLREWEIVADRRDGPNVYYSLTNEKIAEYMDGAKKIALAIQGDSVKFSPLIQGRHPRCTCPKCAALAGNN
jgi:ArsR family transcriptional regulator